MIFNHIGGRNGLITLVPYVLFVPFLLSGSQSSAQIQQDAENTSAPTASVSKDSIPDKSTPLVADTAIVSPDGRYVAVHLDRGTVSRIDLKSENFDYNAFGYVYVLDRENLTATILSPYTRAASILWSPTGSHLAFDDAEGSNSILCSVYSFIVENGKLTHKNTNVSDLFMKRDEAKVLLRMSHQYIFAKQWIDQDTLLVDVQGHAAIDDREPDWIEWSYEFNLNTESFTDVTDSESSPPTDENVSPLEAESK